MYDNLNKCCDVLIVDDDADLLFLLQTQLVSEGVNAQTNLGGKGIIEQIINCRPPVILMDIQMGDVSGKEICRIIKSDSRFNGIKVLFLSGNYAIENEVKEAGADGFITKPVGIEDLKRMIGK